MRALKPAIALLIFATSAFTQVTDYRKIETKPLRAFTQAQPKRVELSNGMVILLQEDHELPLIRGSALIHGGARDVPADKAGLVGILAGSWRTGGTETKTGDQLDDILEARAARVETSGSEDSTRVTLDVLKGDFDFVFPIFVEILQKPAFRQDKIDLAKTQARTAISRRNDEPQSILFREAQKLGYGADSPYARQSEYATISAITRDDLLAFHKRFVQPNNIVLGLVGDFDTATMEKKLRDAFSSWKRGPQAPPPPAVSATTRPGVYYAAKEDVTQGYVAAIHPATILRRDPDYYAVVVMNEILSGGFSGRLMNEIRSKAGLAYGVGGGLAAGWDRPMLFNAFIAGTKSPTTIQSTDLLKQQIANLGTKPFTAEELQHAKDTILNAFVFTVDSKAKVLNQRQLLEFYGYPADYWQKYQKGIEAVTVADVERVAKKYVHPEQLAILVVGNQKDFEKPLASAYGKVSSIDITIPEPGAAPATKPAAGSSATATPLVNKVRDFVGGKSAIAGVQVVREVGTMSIRTPQGPMDVDVESITLFPDSHRQVVKTPMGEMTMVTTPTLSFMVTPEGAQDMPASQSQSMRGDSKQDLLNVLKNADNPAYTFKMAGTEKVGDINAQIIEVNAEGLPFKWYVDPASGRILRKVAQGRSGEQVIDFNEWKTVSGINLPVSFTVTAGGQPAGGGKLTTIEINPTVDPKAFEKPAK